MTVWLTWWRKFIMLYKIKEFYEEGEIECADGSGAALSINPDGRSQGTAYCCTQCINCRGQAVFTIDPRACVAFQPHESLVRSKVSLWGSERHRIATECHHLHSPPKDSRKACSITHRSWQKVASNSDSSGKFPDQSVPGLVKQRVTKVKMLWLKSAKSLKSLF